MEQDREAINVGPEAPVDPSATQSLPKQPKRRIVGRRTVADKAAKKGGNNEGDQTTSDAVAGE